MSDISIKPLLIFGGNYSNLHATQALKTWADEQGFMPEQIICTGDIVAYCANPQETVDLIRDWIGDKGRCIQGNVEQSLAAKSNDCGCGFEEGTTCDILSKGWYDYAQQSISAETREWFASLPETLSFSLANKRVQIVHGAPSEMSRFMFDSMDDAEFVKEFELVNADIILAGHSGLPFTKRVDDGRLWHNSGAMGMPANDGTSNVWFSVLEADDHGDLSFQHHSLDYDFKSASQMMKNHGLTQGYDESLLTGLWPSMDVLPDLEKEQQGIKLS